VALRPFELRRKVTRRHLDWATWPGGAAPVLAIQLDFDGPLDPATREALQQEAQQAAHAPVEGTIEPRFVEVGSERVDLYLDPVHPGAIRLDQLIEALPDRALEPGLAATIVGTIAQVLSHVHQQPGPDGGQRVHHEIHPRSVLLTPGGALALIGSGLPRLAALLISEPRFEADRFRPLSPELARGEPVGPAADLYALGVLYYQLLAGLPYRHGASATAICTQAIEGAAPDLPGALVGARPSLLALLSRCLSPEPEDRPQSGLELAALVSNELHGAGLVPATPEALSKLLERLPAVGSVVGPMALLAPAADLNPGSGRPRARPIADDLAIARPPEAPPPAQTPAAPPADAWSAVLGEAPTPSPGPEAPAPAPKLQLPGITKKSPTGPGPSLKLPAKGPAPTPPPALADMAEVVEAAVSAPSPKATPKVSRAGYWVALALLIMVGGVWAYGTRPRSPAPSEDPEGLVTEDEALEEEEEVVVDAGAGSEMADAGRRRRSSNIADNNRGPEIVDERPLGLLTVNSKPSGATVELDGGYVGTTPLVLRHAFSQRPYQVTVMAEGHRRWQKSLEPDAKTQTITVMATLERE
jgi:hypothetical protein